MKKVSEFLKILTDFKKILSEFLKILSENFLNYIRSISVNLTAPEPALEKGLYTLR